MSGVIKHLYIYEKEIPTVSIVREGVKSSSKAQGIEARFISVTELRPEHLERSDMVIFIRPNSIIFPVIADRARTAGCFVLTMCDDDLLALPKGTPSIPWRRKALKKTLNKSDALNTCSPRIAEKYRDLTLTKRCIVSDTIVSPQEIQIARGQLETKGSGEIKIVYAAAPDHLGLFNSYVLPIMPVLAEKYGKKISFTFVSVLPDLANYEDKITIRHKSAMPLLEYREFMRTENFDIGIAPLHDDNFSRCKYFNKFIEYTLQGITGVYSNVEPYTYVVKDGVNGLLVDNTPDAWMEKLSRAIEEKSLREKCIKNAISFLETEFNEKALSEKEFRDFPEMRKKKEYSNKVRSWRIYMLVHKLSRLADWIYLSIFYFKKDGIKGFSSKVKEHFRETVSYKTK